MIDSPYLATPGKRISLDRFATDDTGKFDEKKDAKDELDENLKNLDGLQELLYADARHAVLIILQALDAGGKDGTIEHIFSGINPQGCSVTSFKAPSPLELSHDYLWRVHDACPRRGMIGIFNRSHYEDVLVVRVNNLAPKNVWQRRFDHINNFEQLLADEGTTIIKFFLHISRKEQNRRMEKRLADKTKRWKFNPQDLVEAESWSSYTRAYEDVLTRCSTRHAPWYIVPADHKWFRNWVVSDIITRTMSKLDLKYPEPEK